jgi:adenosylhomocysteine nucleosidase
MMRIAVIGAMHSEIRTIIETLSAKKYEPKYSEWHISCINKHDIIIAECGIGKVNAASTTQKAIDRFEPELVINTGVAGGLSKNCKIGDVILGSDIEYHDVVIDNIDGCYPLRETFHSDDGFIADIEEICANLSIRHKRGLILTGDAFIATNSQKESILSRRNGDCVEMESAAIAHICFINKIKFGIIRTICDNADDNAPVNFAAFEKENAKKCAEIILDYLNRIK